MRRLTNITIAREILADSTSPTGRFAPGDNDALEMDAGDQSNILRYADLLEIAASPKRQLRCFAAARETISARRVIQIPITATDFVTRLRRNTAVSCIEACQTPAP
jgi:hypothetical protein